MDSGLPMASSKISWDTVGCEESREGDVDKFFTSLL